MWWQNKNIHTNQLTLGEEFDEFQIPKLGDIIIFSLKDVKYIYTVYDRYLNNFSHDNDIIFKKLGMDYSTKNNFASKIYGYSAEECLWPEYRSNDFKSAGKLIQQLKRKCREYNSKFTC